MSKFLMRHILLQFFVKTKTKQQHAFIIYMCCLRLALMQQTCQFFVVEFLCSGGPRFFASNIIIYTKCSRKKINLALPH